MATKFSTAASATAFTSAHNCSSSVSALRVVKISEKRVSVPAVTSFSTPSALLISPMASRYPFARSRFTLMEASGAPMFTTVSASSVLPREMVAFTSFFQLVVQKRKAARHAGGVLKISGVHAFDLDCDIAPASLLLGAPVAGHAQHHKTSPLSP